MNRSREISYTLIPATKSSNPELYNLWIKLGKGNIYYGYDKYYETLEKYKNTLCDLKFVIKANKNVSLIGVNKLLIKDDSIHYRKPICITSQIWLQIHNDNKLKNIKFYKILPIIIEITKKYLKDNGVNYEQTLNNWRY